ncbi:MAG TPA: DUF169 domain-containing protein [Methanomassiliicoccales archaeon]|nr:DUF169 domain-containing protein [Methanomassiliicoccales archaeon]
MPDKERVRQAREFRSLLNLGTYPIGVKLFEKASDALAVRGARNLRSTATCHMAALARHYREDGVCVSTTHGLKCLWGLSCLGMIQTPERLVNGELNRPFTKNDEAAKALQDEIFMLGNEGQRYNALLVGPLDHMPVEPDVVVAYMTPGQALKVLLGYEYAEGRVLRGTIAGQSSVCSAIAKVIAGEDMVMDIPCVGDRMWGLVPDDHLVMAISPKIIDNLLAGMKATDSFSSHPFRPFLHWSVIFPPDMEAHGKERE